MKEPTLKILAYIASLIFISRVIVLIPDSLTLYYGSFFLVFFILLLLSKNLSLHYSLILLIIACLASILFNSIPPIFNSYERLVSFTLILLLFSPLIKSKTFEDFRLYFFNNSLNIIIVLVIISFILMITDIVPLSYPYNGITVHSMILGPLASFSLIFSIYAYLYKKNSFIYNFLIGAISFVMMLVSSSRGTVFAASISIIFLLYKFNYTQKLRSITRLIILLSIFPLTYPIWSTYIEGVQIKMYSNIERGSITASRESMWEDRLEEFLSSPSFGIGFARMEKGRYYTEEKSQVELGSSYLGVLSMTGVFGFFALIIIILNYPVSLLKSNNHNYYLPSTILLFLLVHMIFEGYIFGSGNSLMLFFWLLVGISSVLIKKQSIGTVKF